MSYYYIFKEENLTEEQNQRLYDLVMELGPRNDVSYAEHVAEIKAEAGQAGFVAGYHKMHIEFVGSLASSEGAEFAASQYAAKIRSGEIK